LHVKAPNVPPAKEQVKAAVLVRSSDALRVARHPPRKHLGAREAQMRERFIASEKVDHFHLVNLAVLMLNTLGERLAGGNTASLKLAEIPSSKQFNFKSLLHSNEGVDMFLKHDTSTSLVGYE
jgi:hypothetical protein